MEWWQIQELMWTSTGIIVTLIVVFGLTLRFAIKPALTDLARLRKGRSDEARSRIDRRIERMEEQLEVLGSSVVRLAEALEFDRQLEAGDPPPEGPPGS